MSTCKCSGSVEREMLRRFTDAYPAHAARLISLHATVNAQKGKGLSTDWRVVIDSEGGAKSAQLNMPGSAGWPDGLFALKVCVEFYPEPDYAARGLRDSMASAAL